MLQVFFGENLKPFFVKTNLEKHVFERFLKIHLFLNIEKCSLLVVSDMFSKKRSFENMNAFFLMKKCILFLFPLFLVCTLCTCFSSFVFICLFFCDVFFHVCPAEHRRDTTGAAAAQQQEQQ